MSYETSAYRILQAVAATIAGGRLHAPGPPLPIMREDRIRRTWRRALAEWEALQPPPAAAALHQRVCWCLRELATSPAQRDVRSLEAVERLLTAALAQIRRAAAVGAA